jgi:diguanylate cyclase (GGDEF)-like protein
VKQGPILLITQDSKLLNSGTPGVLQEQDLSEQYLTAARSVLIDKNLPEEAREKAMQRCNHKNVAFFFWSEEQNEPLRSAASEVQVTLDYLREQNAWEQPLPAPETIDRLRLQTLIDIITTANSHLEPEEVMHTVMTRIHQLVNCEAWSVLILDRDDATMLNFAAAYGPIKEQLMGIRIPIGKGIAGWVAKHRQPLIVNHAKDDPRFFNKIDESLQFVTRDILCAPLISRSRAIGVIEMVNSHKENGFSEDDLDLIQVLVNPAAVAIENAYLFQKTQQLTIQDDLTKLYNARHLSHCLETELRRAQRNAWHLTVIFLDLDGFKGVNDTYGHLQGSQCLIDIGEIVKDSARDTDIVGRYGGDEFMLILPQTDEEGAIIVGERIRDRVECYNKVDIAITASIGIAVYPDHGHTKEQLIRQADKAMYRVKEQGKNGILSAGDVVDT